MPSSNIADVAEPDVTNVTSLVADLNNLNELMERLASASAYIWSAFSRKPPCMLAETGYGRCRLSGQGKPSAVPMTAPAAPCFLGCIRLANFLTGHTASGAPELAQ